MAEIARGWKFIISLIFFGLMIIIGLLSGVSYNVAIYRGLGWTTIFFGLLFIMERLLIEMHKPLEKVNAQSHLLDVTVPSENGYEPGKNNYREVQANQGIQQIDHGLEEMIKNNPERIAELTRKMELD